jgi:microcystin-dependent protein
LLAQSTKEDGGIVVFSGMNANGSFYVGNKKVNSATGTEEIFDTPIPTITGEDISNISGYNNLSTVEAVINRSLSVEGGTNKDLVSQFDGPVIFNNKIVSNSDKGIETSALLLYGQNLLPRNYTIGASDPIVAGNIGDIQYNSDPISGGFMGWVYTSSNRWEKFGKIGDNEGSIENTVGVSRNGTFVGISTLINFSAAGIVLTSSYNSLTKTTTLNFVGASPLGNAIGIYTGSNTFVGLTTQINFSGDSNINIFGSNLGSGITTINVGLSSINPIIATRFIKRGATANNILRADGSDSIITSDEVTTALGYIPANSSSISGGPETGNSVILDQLTGFNGITSIFDLRLNGNLYVPPGGSANLIVSLGGIIQRPGTDYFIPQTVGVNTSKIQFTDPPLASFSHFIVALGGQSGLLNNVAWNSKGDLVVGSTDNNAIILPVGSNGQLLTVDPTAIGGMTWKDPAVPAIPSLPTGSVISVASTIAPDGYLECNGAAISRTTYSILFSGIGTVFGIGNGTTTFNIPDLRGEFIRGWDNGRGIDSSRVFGSAQSSQLGAHSHEIGEVVSRINNQGTAGGGGQSVATGWDNFTLTNTGSTGGSETRPRNIALMYCIKY